MVYGKREQDNCYGVFLNNSLSGQKRVLTFLQLILIFLSILIFVFLQDKNPVLGWAIASFVASPFFFASLFNPGFRQLCKNI